MFHFVDTLTEKVRYGKSHNQQQHLNNGLQLYDFNRVPEINIHLM